MAINNITLNTSVQNVKASTVTAADRESKNLENQIMNKQQRLKHLDSDVEKTAEEKAKERQEVQKQIAELNRKLQLLREEKRKEAAEAAKAQEQKVLLNEERIKSDDAEKQSEEDATKVQEENKVKLYPPVENIQKILASDAVIQQERVLESVAGRKDGREHVLEAEIQSDKLYGQDTSAKREALSASRKKGTFEIEDVKEPKTTPNYVMDSGAKIVIR